MRNINNDTITITKDEMIALQQETIEILRKNLALYQEALAKANVIIAQDKEISENQEKIIDALKERLSMYESDEEQLESTDQERQEQIAFIREHTEWAINEAISWGEYLNIPLNEEQIAQLREEGLALAERMINNEEYIDYSYSSLKDCIEQSITCIEEDIRRR